MDFLAGIIGAIVEAIIAVFTSNTVVKAILAAFVYVFLFTIIPLLIQFLVPSEIMNSLDGFVQMLQGGGESLACSGAAPVTSSITVSCQTVVTMVQFGQGVGYILDWFCFTQFLQAMLPAMAVSFLFRRI